MRHALVFTDDCQLYCELQKYLHATDLSVKFFDQSAAAFEFLKSYDVPFLFLDTRNDHVGSDTTSLIRSIAQRAISRLNVVTIGPNAYPCDIAADLSLISVSHLTLTSQGKLEAHSDENLIPFDDLLSKKKRTSIPKAITLTSSETSLSTREPDFFQVLEDLNRVAHRDVTLLIVGETGTGKTTLARIIHEKSRRHEKCFQQLACGALPADIIESELFGHVRGAFTGADRDKIGRFQAAGQGTLLLDEIDVLDLKQQAKLLKVIETGEYEMVGSTEVMQSQARLITASNLNLEELAHSNRFRSDLYYRLSVLEFRLLPLRERKVDIVPMAVQFINECCHEHDIVIDAIDFEFFQALRSYLWPGNIRELKNHVRRAVLFAEGSTLTAANLSPKVTEYCADELLRDPEFDQQKTLAVQVAANERQLLIQALQANSYNRTRTAKALGISRVGLYKKLRRLGLLDDRTDEGKRAA